MKKFMILFLLFLFVLVFFNGCSKVDDFMWDEISPIPIPGNSGLIIASNITPFSVDLSWAKATDDSTSKSQLEYLVYYSLSDNIDTVSNIEANGTPFENYTNDIAVKSVTGLNENRSYYLNIIVKDEVTNKAAYAMVKVDLPEGRSPIAGNNGVISIPTVTTSPLTLNWSKALDNASSQANLEYLGYYSTNANINSVADIEANGIAVGSYEKDLITKNVTGLIKGLTYYFNIVVKDEAGNKACYSVKPSAIYYTLSYDGNGNIGGEVPSISYYTNGQEVTVSGNTGSLVKLQDGISLNFIGWTNSSGTVYTNGDVFSMGSANVTLYAKWTVLRGTGPAGGLVFYDKGSYSDGWRYLEAAPSDQSGGLRWYNGSYIVTGATAIAIGTGQANTTTIITVQGAGSYAAQLCSDFVVGSYTDWFLPSKDELNKMYVNLQSGTDENSVVYAPVGGFAGSPYYWSSSEGNYNTALGQHFGNGIQNYATKNYPNRVRAVRAF